MVRRENKDRRGDVESRLACCLEDHIALTWFSAGTDLDGMKIYVLGVSGVEI